MIWVAALVFVQVANPVACGDRAKIANWLKQKHGETHQVTLIQSDHLVEIWANNETQTWSVLVTRTNGNACLRDSGRGILVSRTPKPAH